MNIRSAVLKLFHATNLANLTSTPRRNVWCLMLGPYMKFYLPEWLGPTPWSPLLDSSLKQPFSYTRSELLTAVNTKTRAFRIVTSPGGVLWYIC